MEKKNLNTGDTGIEEQGTDHRRILNINFDIFSKYRGMLMGIAILGIMFFHYTVSRGNEANWFESCYHLYIGGSFVDVFLILSGIGLYYSFKKVSNLSVFYEKRYVRILIPYMLIAVPFWFCKDFLIRSRGPIRFLKDLFFITFFQRGTKTFWYIFLICICYLIFPALFQLFEAASDHATEYIYYISLFTFFSVISLMIQDHNVELYENIKMALVRFPAFCGGCLIGKMSYEKRPIPKYVYGIMLASVFVEMIGVKPKTIMAYYAKGLFTFSLCLLFILLLEFLSQRWEKIVYGLRRIFEWIGKYTLELYLLHVGIRNLMNTLGMPTGSRRWTFLLWAVSFALAVPIHWLTNKIISHIRFSKPSGATE